MVRIQRYIFPLLITILFTILVSAAVNLNVTSPTASTLMNGSYPITFTFDGNANVTIDFYNGTDWNSVNTSSNTTSPYTYNLNTTSYVDAASAYQLNITVTNYTNASDTANSVITNLGIDNTPPVTTDDAPGGWQSTGFTVTLTPTDPIATVNYTTYRVDGGSWTNGTSISISTDGNHTLEYYSVDDLGNTEMTNTVYAALDTNAPTVNLYNTSLNTTDTTPGFSFNYTDAQSGTADCTLYFDSVSAANNAAVANNTDTVLTASAQSDGTYTVTVNCTDAAGNEDASTGIIVKIDTTDPNVTASGPSGELASSTTSATLTATTDEASTCKYDTNDVAYGSMGNTLTGTGTSHTDSVAVSSGNNYTFYVRCSDPLNNIDASSTVITFSVANVSSSSSSSGGGSAYAVQLSTEPKSVHLWKHGSYSFQDTNRNRHTLEVKTLNENNVTFVFMSDPVEVSLNEGESADVDLDGDDVPDVHVELFSINSNSVDFFLSLLEEEVAEPTPVEEEPAEEPVVEETPYEEPTEPIPPSQSPREDSTPVEVTPEPLEEPEVVEEGSKFWLWAFLIIAVLIGVGYWLVKSDTLKFE